MSEDYQQKVKELEDLKLEYQQYKEGAEEIENDQNDLYDALQQEYNKKEEELKKAQQQINQLQQDLNKEKQYSEKLEQENQQYKNQLTQFKQLQKKVAELEIENEDLINKNRQLDVEFQSKTNNYDALCEQIAILQNDLEDNKELCQTYEEKMQRLQTDIKEKNEDNYVLEQKLEKIKQEFSEKQEQTIQNLKDQIEKLNIEKKQIVEEKEQVLSQLNSTHDIDKYINIQDNQKMYTPVQSSSYNNIATVEKQKMFTTDNLEQQTVKQQDRYSQQSDELQQTKKLNNANTELEESQPQSLHTFSASSQHIHNTNTAASGANPQFLTEDGGTQNTSNCPTPPNIGFKLKIQQGQQQQQQSQYTKHNKRQASVDLDFQKRINNANIISGNPGSTHLNQQLKYRELCAKQKSQSSVSQQQFLSQQKHQQYLLDDAPFNQQSPSNKSQKSSIRYMQDCSPSLDKIQINSIGLKSSIDMVTSIIKDIDFKMKKIRKYSITPKKATNQI